MLDAIDIRIIAAIQNDIPISLDPYGEIAKMVGCSKKEVIERLKNLKAFGILRRLGAILHHRDLGYMANGLIVLCVTDEKMQMIGEKLAALSQVSHCYQRKEYDDWPYNLYAMVHGKSRDEVITLVNIFAADNGIEKYDILFSTEELKKTSMKYV